MHLQLTPGIDIAQLTLYAFFLFFAGLVLYLLREGRREGYPVEEVETGAVRGNLTPLSFPEPKVFHLPFGQGVRYAPPPGRDPVEIAARRIEPFPGAPYVPTGDPLVDGIGPAAYADRAKIPDLDMHGLPRLAPMTIVPDFRVARGDPGLVGWGIYGADDYRAGTISELWVDRAEKQIRYLQIDRDDAPVGVGPLLAPMAMCKVDRRRRVVICDAIRADQFARVPRLERPDQITYYEEERVQGYFGGGYLYAFASRQEPLL